MKTMRRNPIIISQKENAQVKISKKRATKQRSAFYEISAKKIKVDFPENIDSNNPIVVNYLQDINQISLDDLKFTFKERKEDELIFIGNKDNIDSADDTLNIKNLGTDVEITLKASVSKFKRGFKLGLAHLGELNLNTDKSVVLTKDNHIVYTLSDFTVKSAFDIPLEYDLNLNNDSEEGTLLVSVAEDSAVEQQVLLRFLIVSASENPITSIYSLDIRGATISQTNNKTFKIGRYVDTSRVTKSNANRLFIDISPEAIRDQLDPQNLVDFTLILRLYHFAPVISARAKKRTGLTVRIPHIGSRKIMPTAEGEMLINLTETLRYCVANNSWGKVTVEINSADPYFYARLSGSQSGISDVYTTNDYVEICSSSYPDQDKVPNIIFSYTESGKLEKSTPLTEINNGKSGIVNLNVFTGEYNLKHYDTTVNSGNLSIDIFHFYSSLFARTVKGSDNTLGLGVGWKTNLHQWLYKSKYSAEKEELKVIYTDGNGVEHHFYERWYYETNNEKHYVNRSDVFINELGELTYTSSTGSSYSVTYDVKSDGGLTLTTSAGIFGYRDKTKFIEVTRGDYSAVFSKKMEISGYDLKYELFTTSEPEKPKFDDEVLDWLNDDGKAVTNTIFSNSFVDQRYKFSYSSNTAYPKSEDVFTPLYYDNQGFFTKFAYAKDKISARNQYIGDLPSEEIESNFSRIQVLSKTITKFDTTISDYYETEDILQLKEQIKQYDKVINDTKDTAKLISSNLENAVYGLEELKKSKMRVLVSINQQKKIHDPDNNPTDEQLKAFRMACYGLEGNLKQIDSQIEATGVQINGSKENLAKVIKSIDEYQMTRDNLKKKLNELVKKQKDAPNDFIIDENGNILGFDYKGRLVLIADNYEKAIRIKFKEDTDLIEEIQAESGTIKFNYNNNNLLTEIIDVSGKTILFDYNTTNFLTTIKYDEITANDSSFQYQNDLLRKVIDASGLNLIINYTSNIVTVGQYTTTRKIDDDGIERFPQQQVKNILDFELVKTGLNSILSDNMNEAVTTYAFDELGRPLNVVSTLGVNKDYGYSVYNKEGDSIISANFTKNRILRKFIENGNSTGLSRTLSFSDDNNVSGKIWRGNLLNTDTLVYYFEFQNNDATLTFTTCVELTYKDGTIDTKEITVKNNTKHVLLPIISNKDEISEAKVTIPTISQILNFGIATGTGVFRTYDSDKNLIEEREGLNQIKYLNFEKTNPTKIETTNRYNKTKFTAYSYNENGQLTYSEDQDGNIEEKFYNTNGQLIESVMYNRESATDKTVNKYEYDEEGNITELNGLLPNKDGKINPEKNEYYPGTKKINYQTAPNGLVTSFGFDFYNGNLLSKSAEVDGIANTTNYHYQFGMMTRASHQEFDIHYELDGLGRTTSVDVACNNIVKFEYDDSFIVDGFVGSKVVTKYFNYGNLDNAITVISDIYSKTRSVSDTSGTHITYNYDTFDRLTSTISSKESTHFEYDYRGNVNYSDVVYNDFGKIDFNYNYTTKDQVKEVITKVSDSLELYKYKTKYIYDTLDRVIQVHNYFDIDTRKSDEKLTNEYDPLSRLIKERIHIKGDVEDNKKQLLANEYLYLKSGNQATNLIKKSVTTILEDTKDVTAYNYDEMGNITRIKNNDNDVTYEYDKLSRITRENNRKSGLSKTFEYDESGNILRSEDYAYTKGELTNFISGNTYSYNQGNYQDQLVDFNGEEIEYDGLGRPTIYRDHTLVWSPNSTLLSFDGNQYQYNEQGIRIKKVIGNTTHKYFVHGTKILAEELITGSNKKPIKYKYFSDKLYGFNYEGTEYYYVRNIQGDIVSIINKEGDALAKYIYDAWGNHKVFNNNGAEETNPSFIGNINPFRYRGYYYDVETKLYYLNARYYDPEVGRFISQDNISYLAPETINGLNLYSYCGNNPIMGYDPNGTWDWGKFWKVVGAVTLVLVITAAVVATAGIAAVGLGASSAVVTGIIAGGISGGLIAGGVNLGVQILMNGIDNLDYGSLALNTFIGSAGGSLSGGLSGFSTSVISAASSTKFMVHAGMQVGGNVIISNFAYLMHSSFSGTEMTLDGFAFATLSGLIAGFTFGNSTLSGMLIGLGIELAGYYREFFEKIKEVFSRNSSPELAYKQI